MADVPTTSASTETALAVAATASVGAGAASRSAEPAESDVGASRGMCSQMDAWQSSHS